MRILIVVLAVGLLASAAASPGDDEPGHGHGADAVSGPEQLANETWSHTFTEPGQFEYHCHPHPWMQASITILESNGTTMEHFIRVVEPENYQNWTFGPEELTIRAGDTVTWINEGQVMHRVAQTTEEHAEHIAGAGSTVNSDGHDDDGHDHEGEGGFNKALLWVLAAVGVGLFIAFQRRKGPQE